MTLPSGIDTLANGDGMAASIQWPASVNRLADQWRMPVQWIAGACLATGIRCDTSPGGTPPAFVSTLAEELIAWQREYLSFTPGFMPGVTGQPALRLRELFRAIYCDSQDMRHILMLLAAQHLRLFSPEAGPALADEMLRVYAPVAAMLGMYRARRCWIEQAVRIRRLHEYKDQAQRMGIVLDEPTSEMIEYTVNRQQMACPLPDANSPLPSARNGTLSLNERWHIYTRLREELDGLLRIEFGEDSLPEITLIPELPGHALSRREVARTADQPQLTVRITCRTRGDCYRTLGVVHKVGSPAGSSQTHAIHDFIASPQPNGYRALQTLCLWQHVQARTNPRLIKFYILTEEMKDLNEWGFLAEKENGTDQPGLTEIWWKRLDKPSENLSKRTNNLHADISDYLRGHTLDSMADPLYCFTPQGEIVLLKEGRTALDFAYRVHSQLVHHTAQIMVNGEVVNPSAGLKNGDLVEVTFDPILARIDFAWQDLVRSKRARAKIRAALLRRAGFIHEGRRAFEETLIRQIDLYARRQNGAPYVPPAPSNEEINQFLERAALRQGASTVTALYEELDFNPDLAADLAHRLISERIIPYFRLPGGELLGADPNQIELCRFCRPTPVDDAIIGRLPRNDTLIIHLPGCRQGSPNAKRIELQWVPEDSVESWPLHHLEINTPDQDELLNKILRLVYDIPHAYLFKIEARVNELKRATIDLEVAVKLPQLCHDLQKQIAALAADTQVRYSSRMYNRRGEVRATDMSRQLHNPFTENVATDWRFFGRDEVTNSIIGWINGYPIRSQVMVLHGQRRVGKSSLLKRIADQSNLTEYPSRKVVPVLIDFRSVNLDQPRTMAEVLTQHIFYAIDVPIPRLEPYDDPLVWLDRRLLEVERLLPGMTLLVMIDEFDADFSRFLAVDRRPPTIDKIRALISNHPMIRWLLVVHSVYRADPVLQAALPHLPVEVPMVDIRNLPHTIARQLIVDLSTRHGIQFAVCPAGSSDIPDQIINLTAGNPYFIHVLCRKLLLRVDHERRRVIETYDLERSVKEMLGRPVYFDHLIQHLTGHRRIIVRRVAEIVPLGRRQPLDSVQKVLAAGLGLSPDALAGHLSFLEQIGVLETTGEAHRREIGIPIRLLHEWIYQYWIENQSVEGIAAD